MKTINLYFDFEFTSLSPDAQPISLGIVSDMRDVRDYPLMTRPEKPGKKIEFIDQSLSFYAEFSDFDINRCDDWVKGNVVSKLQMLEEEQGRFGWLDNNFCIKDSFHSSSLKLAIKKWLSQFSDFNIQFVCDCGTFDWYWMLQLLAEWDVQRTNESFIRESDGKDCDYYRRVGLPKLPANISPVPQDLNDLIAIKKGISVREAFDWNRLQFYFGLISGHSDSKKYEQAEQEMKNIHSALWNAKVIKTIYEKLK